MPSLGADMEAGTLAAWRCQVGDLVHRGDIIAEVETDKGIIEVECYESGVITALLVDAGQKVPVGTPLAFIRSDRVDGDKAAVAAADIATRREPPQGVEVSRSAAAAPTIAAAPQADPVTAGRVVYASPSARHLAHELGVDVRRVAGSGVHGLVTPADVRAAATAPPSPEVHAKDVHAKKGQAKFERTAANESEVLAPVVRGARLRVSPLARKRAQSLGVDLGTVSSSGVDSAIHLADVERVARAQGAVGESTGQALAAQAAQTVRMRRAIAAAVTRAKREIPHYYLATTVDLGPASAWLQRYNGERPVTERLVMGALLLKAVALAVHEVPELNAHWDAGGATPLPAVHLGVAISLRGGGLVAPAIRDADSKSLDRLMVELADLVRRARRGKLRASEMSDATISVTSLGERGVETVIPVIQPPQVAMVGFGKVVTRPWVVGDQVRPRPVVTASLAADHRVTDGHRGGLFLAAVEALLQKPEAL